MEVPCETSVQGGPTQELGHDATSENNHASGQIISLQEFNDIRTALCDRDAHASYLLQEMEVNYFMYFVLSHSLNLLTCTPDSRARDVTGLHNCVTTLAGASEVVFNSVRHAQVFLPSRM